MLTRKRTFFSFGCFGKATRKERLTSGSVGALGAVLGLAFSPPVFAETTDEYRPADPGSAIIVTAERRSRNLVEVPASVAVLSDVILHSSGIENLQELGGMVPGLVISPPVGLTSAIYIRGVGADSRNIGFDSRVGVYIDGIYAGQSPAIGQSLIDVERVEILRGPQGTLFGKNSIAGAVNIITRKPSNVLQGVVEVRGGNREFLSLSGNINIPASDRVSARLSANRNRRNGWSHNLFDGSVIGNAAEDSQRGQITVQPTDTLSATIAIDHLQSQSRVFVADNRTDTFATAIDVAAPGPSQVMFSTTPQERRNLVGLSLVLRHHLAGGDQLVSTSSYRDTHYEISFDEDWSASRWFSADYEDRYRDFAQEVQLISAPDAAIRYLLGLYYQRQNSFTDRQVLAEADILQLPFGIAPGAKVTNEGRIRTDSFAAYFNATAKLGNRLEAGIGMRYSIDRKHVDWQILGSQMPAFNLASGNLIDKAVDHDLSPSLSLSYRLASTALAYLRYSEGYKSGGFNLDFVSAEIFPGRLNFNKETVRSYEAGFKANLPQLHMNIGLVGFLAHYANYQVNQFQDLGGGRTAIVIANAASVETKGIETDISARLANGLNISFGASVLDAKFQRFPGGGAAGLDASGKRLPYASKFHMTAAVDYSGQHNFKGPVYPTFHIDLSYRSGFFTTVDNVYSQPLLAGGAVRYGHVNGFAVVNAQFGLAWKNNGINLSVWGRNIFGKQHTNWMTRDFLGTIIEVPIEPSAFGFHAKLRL